MEPSFRVCPTRRCRRGHLSHSGANVYRWAPAADRRRHGAAPRLGTRTPGRVAVGSALGDARPSAGRSVAYGDAGAVGASRDRVARRRCTAPTPQAGLAWSSAWARSRLSARSCRSRQAVWRSRKGVGDGWLGVPLPSGPPGAHTGGFEIPTRSVAAVRAARAAPARRAGPFSWSPSRPHDARTAGPRIRRPAGTRRRSAPSWTRWPPCPVWSRRPPQPPPPVPRRRSHGGRRVGRTGGLSSPRRRWDGHPTSAVAGGRGFRARPSDAAGATTLPARRRATRSRDRCVARPSSDGGQKRGRLAGRPTRRG